MLAVVALHATIVGSQHPADGILPTLLECFFKYGTIGFFLISGFLLGDRMDTSAPLQYLYRRLKTLLIPWTFWFSIFLVYLVPGDIAHHRVTSFSPASLWHAFTGNILTAALTTSFWFVPNLALGMCLLLLFRRYLHSAWLGGALLAINFIYVANIYAQWFSAQHTSAVFGFVGFLWLGSYTANNFSSFKRFMDRVPTQVVAALVLLSYLASLAEVRWLIARHSGDPLNTLRFSNQVFSVLVVLLLFKIRTKSWPGFIDVRQQTFCIYLTHFFFLKAGIAALKHYRATGMAASGAAFLLKGAPAYVLLFAFSYGGSLLLGSWIARQERLRWTIGLKKFQPVTPNAYAAKSVKFRASLIRLSK